MAVINKLKEMSVVGNIYIYIYIYIERERERERDFCLVLANPQS
jgi:hypothetical protein